MLSVRSMFPAGDKNKFAYFKNLHYFCSRNMKRLFYILFLAALPLLSYAEVVLTLNSGQTVKGGIVFQNEEVVVIKSSEGQRFQYPMTEVKDISETVEVEETEEEDVAENSGKKVGISLHLSAGAGFIPHDAAGAGFDAMVYVGACNLLDKHIFVGGGVGFESFFVSAASDKSTATFIPVQVRFSAPLMSTPHAPALGCSLGYGFSTKGIDKGGLAASFDAGWRWQINGKSAMFAGLTASLQQGKTTVEETIEDKVYTSTATRNFCKLGVKFAVQF